ncbi:Methionine synthase II (Cobalamin-independent) [Acidipropionibacterium acidipropionici ATCC 4875]|uniref:Methionine synthase II (Cobalamin-independent) n=1 Tax=Acidipropionibacterium acidipropionici (strain ATCC 4875 / DSM 20272 / JCM 6432 / NBRC 12425 / NCIMB 8070 / 4) TaxID=1171373 RepID=K7S043_ACIA4|nr:cobalamin-independent methionine synthase II family protein [Acidipropionibacterium acidipropionici]AFV87892.1 Methionine synthase II (Cobalamin-independent) [Acidipropionibacterium acidipropionici ATCC 4875]ALN14716.1 methionine synthase [Acidipropionibacterium acidipropionici]APZ09530.1 epoxyalkane--coenzyme M transferase [Acidipropionibacterium acidipropionici]
MPVRTTHVGSLPRTPVLLDANAHRAEMGEEAFGRALQQSVDDVVRRQHEIGLSIINDGEYGHAMTESVDYGAWWFYSFSRFGGLELTTDERFDMAPPAPGGKVKLASFSQRRDWVRFADAYGDPASGIHTANQKETAFPTITGPLTYIGQDAVAADIDGLLSALKAQGLEASDGFLAALSPGSAARISNAYYANDTEVVGACADALHEEYKAITDAGLTVQIDDPSIAESWDQINPAPSVEDYRDYIQIRIDALNQALEGIPEEQVRFHVCWGSWHGPHTTDIPLADIVDKVLQVHAHGYSFEAANARHEHEWTVWKDIALPDDKVLLPGVVGHSTNVVEHPALVAQRIRHFIDAVGAERVIASTDCGLGGRVYPSIAWAKLEALTAGAALV